MWHIIMWYKMGQVDIFDWPSDFPKHFIYLTTTGWEYFSTVYVRELFFVFAYFSEI